MNQRLAVRLLEKPGHTVVIAAHGQAALAALTQHAFDLILMDVQMPIVGGLEATAAIRAQEQTIGAHLPIIAMSAHAMDGIRDMCLATALPIRIGWRRSHKMAISHRRTAVPFQQRLPTNRPAPLAKLSSATLLYD